ncbi:MAG: hypothetical protein OXE42_00290 [Gammaproteobacteria bacterium]|nr:hypothetical protein [Gammaproteobacteria bacterium]
MTRDEFAEQIHWPFIIWTMGIINVGAMLPQLVRLIQTQVTEGLAIQMFIIYAAVQAAFAVEGYFKRSTVLMICMTLSAIISVTVIALIIAYS